MNLQFSKISTNYVTMILPIYTSIQVLLAIFEFAYESFASRYFGCLILTTANVFPIVWLHDVEEFWQPCKSHGRITSGEQ